MGVESSVSSLSRVNGTRPTSSVLRIRDLASFSPPSRFLFVIWDYPGIWRSGLRNCLVIYLHRLRLLLLLFFFWASFKQGIKTDGEFILEASIKWVDNVDVKLSCLRILFTNVCSFLGKWSFAKMTSNNVDLDRNRLIIDSTGQLIWIFRQQDIISQLIDH